jgi:hypothetical protein
MYNLACPARPGYSNAGRQVHNKMHGQFFHAILTDPDVLVWLSWTGVAVGVLGLILSYYFYVRGLRSKRPYCLTFTHTIAGRMLKEIHDFLHHLQESANCKVGNNETGLERGERYDSSGRCTRSRSIFDIRYRRRPNS